MATILLVDDSLFDRKIAAECLSGAHLLQADSLETARIHLRQTLPDLILLDLHLPDGTGLELCAELRNREAWREVPVILLTSSSEIRDKVLGFALGAEDYIVKPFRPEELKARVAAKIRKKSPLANPRQVRNLGDLKLDLDAQKASLVDAETEIDLQLTPQEFRILRLFAQYPHRVLSREKIIDRIWEGRVHVTNRNVDSQISKLRKKLKPSRVGIEAVYGEGYQLAIGSSRNSASKD